MEEELTEEEREALEEYKEVQQRLGIERRREEERKEKKEEVQRYRSDYEELESVLRFVRPKDERIPVIVELMGLRSLDDLKALRDILRSYGWKVADIKAVIELWGYRRGLIQSVDEIENIIPVLKKDKEKKEKEKEEEEEGEEDIVEKAIEEEKKEIGKTIKELYDLERLDQLRKRRQELMSLGAKREEEKIPVFIDGRTVELTTNQFLAYKQYQEWLELQKEKEKEKPKGEMVTWTFKDGTVREVPISSVPFLVMSEALSSRIDRIEEYLKNERSREEDKDKDKIEVTLKDGHTVKVSPEQYYMMQMLELQRERLSDLKEEVARLREREESFNPFELHKNMLEYAKSLGWAPSGKTEWDVIAQIASDVRDTVTFLGGKVLDKYGIEQEYNPGRRYTKEERGRRIEVSTNRIRSARARLEAEEAILNA